MPPASRLTDAHACPVHGGGPVITASFDTIIAFLPAARVSDLMICPPGVDVIKQGSSNVHINNLEAARIGDPTAHGGVMATGAPTVIIGESPQTFALKGAAATGKPFCEECEKLRKQREEQEAAAKDAEKNSAGMKSTDKEIKHETPVHEPNPYTTTEKEREIAAQPGNTPEQRTAREKVIREFYFDREDEGLGDERADQDMGTGGSPPRPNGSPKGYGIDLGGPVKVVAFPPPETVSMFCRNTAPADGLFGNFIDPLGNQTGDQLGLNDDPNFRKKVVMDLPKQGGLALQTQNGPILDDWTDKNNPKWTKGGGTQWSVPNSVKEGCKCVKCGSPQDPSVDPHRWPEIQSFKQPPRRCTCK